MGRFIIHLLLASVLVLANRTAAAVNKTYYVDNVNGSDDYNGMAPGTPWRTLDKVNHTTFSAGDRILLKRNDVFEGCLRLHGSGGNGKYIRLGAFGMGKRPVIHAAAAPYAIRILDGQYWAIRDMETSGGEKAGIFIGCTRDSVSYGHFRIVDCDVHDVGNDSLYTYDYSTVTGGIVVANGYMDGGKEYIYNHASFSDVVVDGCTVKYIKRWTCISISSGYASQGDSNDIRNCTVAYSVADGIRMNGVKNSRIEYCTMYKNGAWPRSPNPGWGGLGAWFFGADHCTIQFCEASHIDSPHEDGGAFDIDYWQTNSTVQYCYGHDCHGYGVSVFGADSARPTVNSVVRYNIFSNNARDSAYAYQGDIYVFTWGKGLLDGVKIYNNTSYWHPAADAPALNVNADFTGRNPDFFRNNIIYADSPWLVYRKGNRLQCDYNLYWVTQGTPRWRQAAKDFHSLAGWQLATGQDRHSLYEDPQLNDPSYHGEPKPGTEFLPQPHSPVIGTGVRLLSTGGRDFLGNKIPVAGKYNIGACASSIPN